MAESLKVQEQLKLYSQTCEVSLSAHIKCLIQVHKMRITKKPNTYRLQRSGTILENTRTNTKQAPFRIVSGL